MELFRQLNQPNPEFVRHALLNCCASPAWVEGMLARRPFADDKAVIGAAAEVWSGLGSSDWLEAFAAHPMIGDVESLRKKYAATKKLAAVEQSGVADADEATLAELARLNREYRERFGFIFIVFASGKSAVEMLAMLKQRLEYPRDVELENAAAEQLKITQLRLQKLAARPGDP
jgi:2-oxo-4-hydroxy-4-carboxy-5-ureidoimidazoline decarboxylase